MNWDWLDFVFGILFTLLIEAAIIVYTFKKMIDAHNKICKRHKL